MAGIISIISGIIIQAIQNMTEDKRRSLISLIVEHTYLLPDYLWLGKYIKIQKYHTQVEEYPSHYSMGYKITVTAEASYENTYKEYPENI